MDILEKALPSAKDEGNLEQQSGEKGAEDISGDQENVPQSTRMKEIKEEKNCLLPVQPRDKRQAGGLNVNNEVVKMRKEVKRVRALITRKLIRQIGALKKKKGKDTEMERNNRRAVRLLEEIHAMKVLPADLVTKTALQKNLNFEHVFNNSKSTISDRALTRIAAHPHFRKRIELIRAAMKAFKEERIRAGKQRLVLKGDSKMVDISTDLRDTVRERQDDKEEMIMQKESVRKEAADVLAQDIQSATVAKPEQKRMKSTHSAYTAEGQSEEVVEQENARWSPSIKTVMENVKDEKDLVPESAKKSRLKSAPDMQVKDEEVSDQESLNDEEKESFDDSTEERFQGQSSLSEESDHDDDFFVGKLRKFKKKKRQKDVERKVGVKDPADQVQNELHVVKSRLNTKTTLLQSLFCSSLSVPGMADARGRDDCKSRVQETPRGGSSQKKKTKQTEFPKKKEVSGFKSKNLSAHCRCAASQSRGFSSCSRCRCHRKPDIKEKWGRDEALHPSWEASKKRKEQQGQILAFQGTKIRFDDDD